MRIKRDFFNIESGAREADGTKLEPEQQAVQRVMVGMAPVEITSPGVVQQGTVGTVPIEIVAHSDAKSVARSVSALCGNCRWFDNVGWRKMLARAEGPMASPGERQSVNDIRAQLLLNMPDPDLHVGEDNDYDVEHAMQCMGLCAPLREFYKAKDKIDEPHGVWPSSGCPLEVCSKDKPHGFFEPRDGDARKALAANFDAVMMRAAGKVLK